MPENEEAFGLWLSVRTQWRAGGMGVIGLDYAEVRFWADYMGIDLSGSVWNKIQALERWQLRKLNANGKN